MADYIDRKRGTRMTLEEATRTQDILQYLDEYLHPIVSPDHWSIYSELYDMVSMLSSTPSTLHGYNIEHLELIARILQKENLSPERIVEALTDIGRIVAIVKDEFKETLRKASIEALGERPMVWNNSDYELGCANQWDSDKLAIENVLSKDI